jgi:hypothetical protein
VQLIVNGLLNLVTMSLLVIARAPKNAIR